MESLMRCDEAETLLAVYAVGEIDDGERAQLSQHLAGCADCRSSGGKYLATATLLAVAADPVSPPARLRANIMAQVYAESRGPAKQPRPGILARAWASMPQGRAWTLAGVLTSVVILGASLASFERGSSPVPTPAIAMRTVAMTAAGPAPEAGISGDVTYGSGSSPALVKVHGLPSPSQLSSPGAVYEVWLERPDQTVAAASYLTLEPDGDTWMAPLSANMASYTAVIITVEPKLGDLRPLGTVVAKASMPTTA